MEMHEEMGGGKEEKMSVLVKGMEMPKNCTFCEMWHGVDCHPYQGISPPKSRPDHCPIIEIPPHGRLIDADKLLEYWQPDHDRLFVVDYFIHTIEHAKTIIPAEPCNDLAKPNNASTIIGAEGRE